MATAKNQDGRWLKTKLTMAKNQDDDGQKRRWRLLKTKMATAKNQDDDG